MPESRQVSRTLDPCRRHDLNARSWQLGLAALVVTIAMAAGSSLGFGQDDAPLPEPPVGEKVAAPEASPAARSAAQELQQLNLEIRQLRASAQATRKSQNDRLQRVESELRSKRRTLEAIQKELKATEDRVQERNEKLDGLTARVTARQGLFSELDQEVNAFLERMEGRVRAGVPWLMSERLNTLALSKTAVSRDGSTPAEAVAIAGRLQKDEEALGRLVEVDTLSVDVPDQGKVAVKAVRIGLLGVVFSNPGGEIVGFSGPGATLEQGLEAVRGNPEAADGYLRAIEILNRERTPGLIDILFPKFPVQEAKR